LSHGRKADIIEHSVHRRFSSCSAPTLHRDFRDSWRRQDTRSACDPDFFGGRFSSRASESTHAPGAAFRIDQGRAA